MKSIQIQEDIFLDQERFHAEFSRIMGFPDFYGSNWDAWIDCMSHINETNEAMSEVTVAKDEALEIEVLVSDGREYDKTSVYAAFSSCVSAVNGRFSQDGSKTRIIVTEKILTPDWNLSDLVKRKEQGN